MTLTTLLYLIVIFIIHVVFFLTTTFNNKWQFINTSRQSFYRYFKHLQSNKFHSGNIPSLNPNQTCLNVERMDTLTSFGDTKISSVSSFSSTSDTILETETTSHQTIRSFGFLLCGFLFVTNWLRISIYLLPQLYPNRLQYSSNFCLIQSFILHVLTLFHLNVTISIRLLWHYCFIVSEYWRTITYRRLITFHFLIFLSLCIFTWPSISDDWASIIYDRTLNICIVDYTFHFSYTFFVISFTCVIPFLILVLSHHRQTICMKRRLLKSISTLTIEQSLRKRNLINQKNQFQYVSFIILLWSFVNILLLICIHIPAEHNQIIKSSIFYTQMFTFICDPILYIFVFRSLSIITLLRPTNELL